MALSVDDLQQELNRLRDASSGAATGVSQFGQALAGSSGGIGGFNKMLQGGSQTLGSLAKNLGPLGRSAGAGLDALSKTLGLSLDQIDRLNRVYMTLGNSGLALGETQESLRERGDSFGQAIGLNEEAAQRFAKLLTSNSKDLARLSGTAVMGSRRLAEAFEAMGPVRVALQNIGISYEDQIEGLAAYTRMQAATGRAQRMSTEQLAQGSADYLRKLQDLAAVTGVSREEQMKAHEAARAEQRFGALVINEERRARDLERQGRVEEAAQVRKNIQELENFNGVVAGMDEEMAKGLRDMAAGAVNTPEARKVARTLGGDAQAIVSGLKTGTMSSAQALQRLGQATDRHVDRTAKLAQVSGSYQETFTDLSKANKIAQLAQHDVAKQAKDAEAARRQQEKNNEASQARVNIASNKLRQTQIEAGRALEGTQDAALTAADAIGTKMVEVLPILVDRFNELATSLTTTTKNAKTFGEFLEGLAKAGKLAVLPGDRAGSPRTPEDVDRARDEFLRQRRLENEAFGDEESPAPRSDVRPLTVDQIQALQPSTLRIDPDQMQLLKSPTEPVVQQVKIAADQLPALRTSVPPVQQVKIAADQLPALRTSVPPVQQVKIAADQLKDLKLPGLSTQGFGESNSKMPSDNDMIRSQAADITRKYMDLVGDIGLNSARDTMENFRFPDLDDKMPNIDMPGMTEMLANKANIMSIKMPELDLPAAPAASEIPDQTQQMQDQFQAMMDQVTARPETNNDQPLLNVMNQILDVQRQQSATMMKMLQFQRN